jgi:hypothetical protein
MVTSFAKSSLRQRQVNKTHTAGVNRSTVRQAYEWASLALMPENVCKRDFTTSLTA